jgi:hypothetical protein
VHRQPTGGDRYLNGAIEVSAENPGAMRHEAGNRGRSRVAVGVGGPGRDDRNTWPDRTEKRVRRRRAAPVVGDLQEIDLRQTAGQQLGIDGVLDVAGQQDPSAINVSQENDRDVVDPRSRVRRMRRHGAWIRPQDTELEIVDCEVVAGRERAVRGSAPTQCRRPGLVAGTRTQHPRFVDAPNPIAAKEHCQPGDVVFVGMREDDGVEATVPWRQLLIEVHEEAIWVGPAVDQQSRAARALDQDRVALAHVEDRDPSRAVGSVDPREAEAHDGHRQGHCRQNRGPARGRWAGPPLSRC